MKTKISSLFILSVVHVFLNKYNSISQMQKKLTITAAVNLHFYVSVSLVTNMVPLVYSLAFSILFSEYLFNPVTNLPNFSGVL